MNSFSRPLAIVAGLTLLAIAFATNPSDALDRSDGDFWRYDVLFEVAGVTVSGTVEYSYAGDLTIAVNGTPIVVSLIRIDGSFSGSENDSSIGVWVTGLFDGFRYETKDGIGIVGEALTTIANVSTGYEGFQVVTLIEATESVNYSEPLLSGFDLENWRVSAVWNETIEVQRTESYSDGSFSYENDSAVEFVFNVSSVPASAPFETEAGNFECSIITASDGITRDVFWYSEDVGGFVGMARYDLPSSTPSFTAQLSDYEHDSGSHEVGPILAALGLVAASALLVSVVAVAIRRRVGTPPSVGTEAAGPMHDGGQEDPIAVNNDEVD